MGEVILTQRTPDLPVTLLDVQGTLEKLDSLKKFVARNQQSCQRHQTPM